MWHVRYVVSSTCMLSHSYLFQNLSYWIQFEYRFKLISETYLIREVQTFYMPPFALMMLSYKYKSIFSPDKMACPSIMSYLWWPFESSTNKLHLTLYFKSSPGKTIYIWFVKLVLKSPPYVHQQTGLVFFFQESCICFSIIIEDLDMGYIKILSESKLVLTSIPLFSTHITGVWWVISPFYFIYNLNLQIQFILGKSPFCANVSLSWML